MSPCSVETIKVIFRFFYVAWDYSYLGDILAADEVANLKTNFRAL